MYMHVCIKYFNRKSNLLTANDMPGELCITLLQYNGIMLNFTIK